MSGKSISSLRAACLLVLFSLLLASCSSFLRTYQDAAEQTPATNGEVPGTGATPEVVITDQEYDGVHITVQKVVSAGPGWIAIHSQEDGHLGPAIGFAPVKEGENLDVVVEIDANRATPVMYAMLHRDLGTVGAYEFPGLDEPALVDGEMLAPPFNAALNAAAGITPAIIVQDQDITDGTVKMEQVASPNPGWLAIFTHVNGEPGSEIGHVAIPAGETRDVSVSIDVRQATAVLYAILYQDAGAVGDFEIPDPDRPVLVAGQPVSPSFRVAIAMALPAETGEAGHDMPGMEGTIQVSDQEIVDGTVKVDEVVSSGPGWIVIYTAAGGQPDTAIGRTAVQEGVNREVVIAIDSANATQELFAVLHADAGAAGTFEFPGPDQPVMQGVRMVLASFQLAAAEATADPASSVSEPAVIVSDQVLRGDTIVIDQVYSEGPGWMGMHIQGPDGGVGNAIGFGPVQSGLNDNVLIQIDQSRATPVMYAMLHFDKGEVGTLEFPGPDVPVMLDGEMVITAFNILAGVRGNDVTIQMGQSEGTSYLTDVTGLSLYVSLNDTPGKSNCDALCRQEWLPLLATGRLVADQGVDSSKLGVIVLPNGNRQVAYAGQPLYYYRGDQQPGDIAGQGMDGLWFLALP